MQALRSQGASGDGAVMLKLARDFVGGSGKLAEDHADALFLLAVVPLLGIEEEEGEDGIHQNPVGAASADARRSAGRPLLEANVLDPEP